MLSAGSCWSKILNICSNPVTKLHVAGPWMHFEVTSQTEKNPKQIINKFCIYVPFSPKQDLQLNLDKNILKVNCRPITLNCVVFFFSLKHYMDINKHKQFYILTLAHTFLLIIQYSSDIKNTTASGLICNNLKKL